MARTVRRRLFLGALGSLFAGARRVFGALLQPILPNRNEERAVAEGKRLGIGSVKLLGPRQAEVVSHQTWTLVYTAGPAGVEPGGGIRIAMRHLQTSVATPQATNPVNPNYITAEAGGLPVTINTRIGLMNQYFPWQEITQVTLLQQKLEPGKSLRVTIGDRSAGSPGMLVQPYDESHYGLKCYVDVLGKGEYLPVEEIPTVEIIAAAPYRLSAVMPSDAVTGEPTWCLVRAEDRYGNPTPRFRGRIALRSTVPGAALPESHVFAEEDRGVYRFEGIRFAAAGIQRIEAVSDTHSEEFRATANPVRVTADRPSQKVFWGDLHGHTLFSDGRGTVEEYYDYAEQVAGLDFCAVTDHDFEILDEMWAQCKAVTNRRNRSGRFVTFHGFEWSGWMSEGGDHNVYFLEEDPPIYRCTSMYDSRNLQMDHAGPKVRTVAELYARLSARLKDKDVFCIPHFGGRPASPRWHDPRVQRLIEIYSDHRRSEPWANSFLKAGHRLGIMASSDNHYGNPGYGYLRILNDWDKQEIGTALVAVYAAEQSRESIFHALYDRRTYATSGSRILLDFRLNGQPMGSEVTAHGPPLLAVDVVGTASITQVEIKKNGKPAFVTKPNRDSARLEWRDDGFRPGEASCYYVRIVQADHEEAISSPIWVDG